MGQPTNDKFKELVLHIARKSESDPKFGATKLNKLLFFADFRAFYATGKSITDQEYQKREHGPTPRRLLPVREELEAAGDISTRRESYYGHRQEKTIALRPPNLEIFSAQEIAIVDEVIEEFREMSATKISRRSHEFVGWKLAEIGETIPYGIVWVNPEAELTDEELEYARHIEPLSEAEKTEISQLSAS